MQAKHVLVAGSSGGGKTTYAREMFDRHDGVAVWVNHNEEDGVDGHSIDGCQTVTSRAEMERAVRRCGDLDEVRNLRFNFVCTDATAGTEVARRFAQAVGDHFDARVCTLVVVDEAHNVMPDSDESSVDAGNPLAGMLHEDRDDNVKAVAMTQDPVELYYPPVKQCKFIVWCGEQKIFHRGFLRYYALNELDLPDEDHEFVVVKPTDPPKIVSSGETKEVYG